MSPCKPTVTAASCKNCKRYAPRLPTDPEQRTRTVAIDASVLPWPGRLCPLHEAKPARMFEAEPA